MKFIRSRSNKLESPPAGNRKRRTVRGITCPSAIQSRLGGGDVTPIQSQQGRVPHLVQMGGTSIQSDPDVDANTDIGSTRFQTPFLQIISVVHGRRKTGNSLKLGKQFSLNIYCNISGIPLGRMGGPPPPHRLGLGPDRWYTPVDRQTFPSVNIAFPCTTYAGDKYTLYNATKFICDNKAISWTFWTCGPTLTPVATKVA